MKWTVQRYVLREVVQTWLAVTGILVAILVSNQLSRVLGQAADNQYGRHVVFDLIALGAIMFVAAFSLFGGNAFGRVVGLVAATLGAIGALLDVGGQHPWWALGVFAICLICIHGLLVLGQPREA